MAINRFVMKSKTVLSIGVVIIEVADGEEKAASDCSSSASKDG
jgi:hypothetical protein